MPEQVTMLENKLRARARRRGITGERQDAYVFSIMRRMGWKRGQPMKDIPNLSKI
jgi:hypothetical protein